MFETPSTDLAEQCECTICPKLLQRTRWLTGEVRRESVDDCQFYLIVTARLRVLGFPARMPAQGSARAHPAALLTFSAVMIRASSSLFSIISSYHRRRRALLS